MNLDTPPQPPGPESVESMDEKFMRRTIELANQSVKEGDFPFGAVLVLNGTVVAEGFCTQKREDPLTGHSEANAMRRALATNENLEFSQCTIYSNCAPCIMCSYLIRDLGIGRVVFGVASPYVGGQEILSRPIPDFARSRSGKASPPVVRGGVLEKEAREVFDTLGWRMHQ